MTAINYVIFSKYTLMSIKTV